MFKTRKVIAEIFSIVGAIRQQCTWNLLSGPHYEFVCKACKKTFSKILTISEHDAERTAEAEFSGIGDVRMRVIFSYT